jgi:hypothetical protein
MEDNMVVGKRTYAALALLFIKDIALPTLGVTIPDEDISKFIDIVLIISAAVFRFMAERRHRNAGNSQTGI